MAALTWPEVVALDSDLAEVHPLVQERILARVMDRVDPAMLGGETGGKYLLARLYLAAHHGRLALPGDADAAGPVISKSADGLSKSYAAPSVIEAEGALGSTRWGRLYHAEVRASTARAGYSA